LVGAELGLLDQELAKLALFCEQDDEVGVELVRQVVGGWRTKTTWELLDAVLDGHAAAAVGQLERLLQAGEAPQAIAGAVFWSLRRFADAAQAVLEAEDAGRKISLPAALQQAGFKNWPQGALQQAERQIRQIGRIRAGRLYGQLLALDLALKGSHSTPTRTRWALEQFIFSLSRAAAPNA
jgi:DNA polymerase-3 subunit delta